MRKRLMNPNAEIRIHWRSVCSRRPNRNKLRNATATPAKNCTQLHLIAPNCGKTAQNKNSPMNRNNRNSASSVGLARHSIPLCGLGNPCPKSPVVKVGQDQSSLVKVSQGQSRLIKVNRAATASESRSIGVRERNQGTKLPGTATLLLALVPFSERYGNLSTLHKAAETDL